MLYELGLSDNDINSLPDAIGNLKGLGRLYLNSNKLKTLPNSISNLKELEELYLHENLISSESQKQIKVLLPQCRRIYFSL